MRILTRRLAREQWCYTRSRFDIDESGSGLAVYTMQGPERTYSLIAFAHDIPDEDRSDRVIAEVWDATFTLFDGVPNNADLARLAANVPRQEGGRLTETELTLSRANRSARLWEHIVASLASGQQPDLDQLRAVGYLMRTTAVYGSGKFGAADRESISERAEFAEPFQVEMLNVYLIRSFVVDLVERMAAHRGQEQAVRLAQPIARQLGIGNSTGLGMAPFIINHPILFNNWISAREEALRRVRSVPEVTDNEVRLFRVLLKQTQLSVSHWKTHDPAQAARIIELQIDLERLDVEVSRLSSQLGAPWDRLYRWAEQALGIEAQECLVSLLLEPYPDLVDELCASMSSTEPGTPMIDGSVAVGMTRAAIECHYDWAKDIDWDTAEAQARAWYVSREKLEPRLGERFSEDLADYEQPLAPARDVMALYHTLESWADTDTLAAVLLQHPEHRYAARRVQIVSSVPYAEIHDNTIDAAMRPIDMLRCKLSFFGATHFDPRSDRWLRICLFAGAPFPDELNECNADRWIYPTPDVSDDEHQLVTR